jgi:hypothetical protein
MRAASILNALLATTVLTVTVQEAVDPPQEVGGGLLTLYAGDDLRSSFSLRQGGNAARIVDGEIDLDGVHIVFDVFESDMLTFGFLKNERVNVLDLGPVYVNEVSHATDRSPKFPISVFHTLYVDGGRFAYRGPGDSLERHEPADWIFDTMPGRGYYHLEPVEGHTYVIRTKRMGVGEREMLGKLQIVDFRPGHSLTIRWSRIAES